MGEEELGAEAVTVTLRVTHCFQVGAAGVYGVGLRWRCAQVCVGVCMCA